MRTGWQTWWKLGAFLAFTSSAMAQEKTDEELRRADLNAVRNDERKADERNVRTLFLDEDGNLFDGRELHKGEVLDPFTLSKQSVRIVAHPNADVQRLTKLFGDQLKTKVLSIQVTANVPKLKPTEGIVTSDRRSANESQQTNILYLKYLSVSEAERIVKEIITHSESVRIAADPRLNAMIVRSSQAQLQEIEELIKQIDREPPKSANRAYGWREWRSRTHNSNRGGQSLRERESTQQNRFGDVSRDIYWDFQNLDTRAYKLADEIRGASSPNDKIKKELKAAVGAAFDARLEAQRNELNHAKRRLEAVAAKLTRRQVERDRIIEERVQQLLRADFANKQERLLPFRNRPKQNNRNQKVERSLAEYDLKLATLKRQKAEASLKEAQRLKEQNVISTSELTRLEFDAKEAAILEGRAKALLESYSERANEATSFNPYSNPKGDTPGPDTIEPRVPQSFNPLQKSPPPRRTRTRTQGQAKTDSENFGFVGDKPDEEKRQHANSTPSLSAFENAKVALKNGKLDDAQKQFLQIVRKEKDNALAYAYLALTLTQLGQHDAAGQAMWDASVAAGDGSLLSKAPKDESQPNALHEAIEAAIAFLEKRQ